MNEVEPVILERIQAGLIEEQEAAIGMVSVQGSGARYGFGGDIHADDFGETVGKRSRHSPETAAKVERLLAAARITEHGCALQEFRSFAGAGVEVVVGKQFTRPTEGASAAQTMRNPPFGLGI